MTQDEAKAIIEREPVGGAQFYSSTTCSFYNHVLGEWFRFEDEWFSCRPWHSTISKMKPMHEILAMALGDEK